MYSLVSPASNLQPRFNICPTTNVDVVIRGDDQRALVPMRWGKGPQFGGLLAVIIDASSLRRADA
jgi:putative SOS response-associated peptidase YedK